MPQWNTSRRLVVRLLLFTLAGWLLWALGRDDAKPDKAVAAAGNSEPSRAHTRKTGFSKRRLATTLAFTTLFFAGAAFSAGAGNELACELGASCDAATSTEAAADESGDTAATETESTEDQASSEDQGSSEDPAAEEAPDSAPSDDESGSDAGTGDADGTSDDGQAADGGATDGGQSGGGQPANDGQSGGGSASTDQGGQQGGGSGSTDQDDQESNPLPPGGTTPPEDNSDDEPDAGPGSPAHAGDSSSSDEGSDVGLTSAADAAHDLEFDSDSGAGVVWLHRTLPDPFPPARRLTPQFAHQLAAAARANHVDWALVLGVLRAENKRSQAPATPRGLDRLAGSLYALRANANEWRAVLALSGRTSFADRAIALARYNRAVGLLSLVRGLEVEKSALEHRVLTDSRLDIYPGGRDDVANHRINVRVLVLMLYMAECHGQVTVSALDSGHRLYARPGVISAHKFGLAVDIAALGGEPILGHQQVGGLTERAVRNILLLPHEMRPKQVISLLGLGGPSFPLADHYDHIHVGY
jgi:hypothetical protein